MFKLRTSKYDVIREARYFPRRTAAGLLGALLLAVLLVRRDWPGGRLLMLVGVLGLLGVVGWWTWDRLMRPLSTGDRKQRSDARSAHTGGTATWVDILEVAGKGAMRRQAKVVRPSLTRVSTVQVKKLPPTAYATYLGASGWFGVYTSIEDATLLVGGPRYGKTQALGGTSIDAPGSLFVTSTRADLLRETGALRARRGRIHVFNPMTVGGYLSTFRWSVLAGCDDFEVAAARARAMVPETRDAQGERWDGHARRVLPLMLHAAALVGYRMTDVLRWVESQNNRNLDEITQALESTTNDRAALTSSVVGFWETNHDTRSSIAATMMMPLQWLSSRKAAELGDAPLGSSELFDMEKFVRSGTDTLYLIGGMGKVLTPLTSALTDELARQARLIAGDADPTQPDRLDPPLTMVLDEAPLVCPLPLDEWTADMGGRGVNIHISAQSFAQIEDVWGRNKAAAIRSNCVLRVFGGCSDTDNLAEISALCGERLHRLDDDDNRYVPVMTPGDLTSLPKFQTLVLGKGLPPVLVDSARTYLRRDVKSAQGTRFTPTVADVAEGIDSDGQSSTRTRG